MRIDNHISRTPSNSFTINQGRRNSFGIDTITLHTTGNTAQSGINTVQSPNNVVSYHYIIDANGRITQHVQLAHIAHHAGTTVDTGASNDILTSNVPTFRQRRVNHNDYSIGIGLGDTFGNMPNNTQFETMAALITHIKTIYNIRYLTTHTDVVPRHRPADPVSRNQIDDFWNRLNSHLKGGSVMNDIEFELNGELRTTPGQLINGRNFVTIADYSRQLGATVSNRGSLAVIDAPWLLENASTEPTFRMTMAEADRIASRMALDMKQRLIADLMALR